MEESHDDQARRLAARCRHGVPGGLHWDRVEPGPDDGADHGSVDRAIRRLGGPVGAASAAPIAGGLLDKVLKAGKLVVSTDPNYAPQSFLKPDGTYEGFDIDVANEIGKRLGVKVEFVTPGWDAITAGSWAGRWDISVGSMTITVPRQQVLDFSPPYYYTPAQMTATRHRGSPPSTGSPARPSASAPPRPTRTGWTGTLQSVSLGPVATPPAGVKVQTLDTDQACAQAIAAGRKDARAS